MSSKIITLKSSDGQDFEVAEAVALECQTIKHMIEDDCADNAIPLPNVTGKILAKIIEYCKEHINDKTSKDELKAFDANFVKLDNPTLFELVLAANYLNVKSLLDITCERIADMIKDLQPEDVREIFNVENDFTREEEETIRKENAWAFE